MSWHTFASSCQTTSRGGPRWSGKNSSTGAPLPTLSTAYKSGGERGKIEDDGVDGTEDSGEVGDDFNDNSSAAINARARLTEAEEADLEADTIRQLIRDALWARWQVRG